MSIETRLLVEGSEASRGCTPTSTNKLELLLKDLSVGLHLEVLSTPTDSRRQVVVLDILQVTFGRQTDT